MHQPGEPSVEEILASIKQVIARDNRAGAAEDRRRSMEPRTFDPAAEAAAMTNGQARDEEVLDLGELAGVEAAPLLADERRTVTLAFVAMLILQSAYYRLVWSKKSIKRLI